MSLVRCGALFATCLLIAAPVANGQALGRVQGVVYDSVARGPLRRATVVLRSLRDSAQTRTLTADSLGRFAADSLIVGPWVALAQHPRLDSLALGELIAPFDVRSGRRMPVDLSIPSPRVLARRVCGVNQTDSDSSGFLIGTVRRADTGAPRASSVVRVQWIDLVLTGMRPSRELSTVDVPTDSSGRYLACGVPVNATVLVRVVSGVDSSGRVTLRVPVEGVRYRDLYVGGIVGRLVGSVRGADGRAVANARVLMLERQREARSDSAGRFILEAVPAGTQAIDVRAMGYEALSDAADVVQEPRAVVLDLTRLMSLDTVRVRAQRARELSGRAAGFEQRRQMGLGRFLVYDDLVRLNAIRISDVIATLPGITMRTNTRGERVPTMRGSTFVRQCVPVILVDGISYPSDFSLDAFVPAETVVGLEFYSSGFTPAELTQPFAACGTIAIWTGPRPIRAR